MDSILDLSRCFSSTIGRAVKAESILKCLLSAHLSIIATLLRSLVALGEMVDSAGASRHSQGSKLNSSATTLVSPHNFNHHTTHFWYNNNDPIQNLPRPSLSHCSLSLSSSVSAMAQTAETKAGVLKGLKKHFNTELG
jgi:hypothetical protein